MRNIDLYNNLKLGESFDFNNKSIKLRNYQVEAIINLIQQYGKGEHGSVFHCSGSGNSLSSYALASSFNKLKGIDGIIIVTSKHDSAFSNSKNVANSTKKLLNMLESEGFLITYSNVIGQILRKNNKGLEKFKDKRFVFIMDDVNRFFQSKHMDKLKSIFPNSRCYSFIATSNHAKDEFEYEMLPNDEIDFLNYYLLDDALREGNLLNVKIEYLDGENPVDSFYFKRFLATPQRVNQISKWIADNHDLKTNNRKFQAILVVPDTNVLFRYYDFLKSSTDLKIGAVFNLSDASKKLDKGEVKRLAKTIIDDFNKMFGTFFSVGKLHNRYKKNVISNFNDSKLDLLIITPVIKDKIDNSNVNTLYVDSNSFYKKLKSFSIVNSPAEGKEFGNIVFFSNVKGEVDLSLKMAVKNDSVELKPYEFYKDKFNENLEELYKIASTPGDVLKLDSIEDLMIITDILDKIRVYLRIFSTILKVKNYEEDISFDYDIFREYRDAVKKALKQVNKPNFNLTSYGVDVIDLDYLNNLRK